MDPWQYTLKFEMREFLVFLLENKRKRNSRFSQRAFAGYIGVSPATLNEILSGKRQITKSSLKKISYALEQDRGFSGYLEEYLAQRPSKAIMQNLESTNQALRQLMATSQVAQKKRQGSGSLFCTVIVAAHEDDFGFLREKVLKSLGEECLFQDIFEIRFGEV